MGCQRNAWAGSKRSHKRAPNAPGWRKGRPGANAIAPANDLASKLINSVTSLRVTTVSMAARPFGYGFSVYDTALREVREWAERDVSVRSWLGISD